MGWFFTYSFMGGAMMMTTLLTAYNIIIVENMYINANGNNFRPLTTMLFRAILTFPLILSPVIGHFIETIMAKGVTRKRMCQILTLIIIAQSYTIGFLPKRRKYWNVFCMFFMQFFLQACHILLSSMTSDHLRLDGGYRTAAFGWNVICKLQYIGYLFGYGLLALVEQLGPQTPTYVYRPLIAFTILVCVTLKSSPPEMVMEKKKEDRKTRQSKKDDGDSKDDKKKAAAPKEQRALTLKEKLNFILNEKSLRTLVMYLAVRKVAENFIHLEFPKEWMPRFGFHPLMGMAYFPLMSLMGSGVMMMLVPFLFESMIFNSLRLVALITPMLLAPAFCAIFKLLSKDVIIDMMHPCFGIQAIAGTLETALLFCFIYYKNSQLPIRMRLTHIGLCFSAMAFGDFYIAEMLTKIFNKFGEKTAYMVVMGIAGSTTTLAYQVIRR